ncbi:ArsI/CadI family heavy metal resistance metalloenzyme [Hymenobacter elongatus]|uniref:Glyoxalase/bleomycin resistance/dioxygenase family protein n=1 Tax=Hymenobacter elongatus TaxID=877208 RepID=A0A4Z0PGA9_9BACT|nr:ArsI/CadI family heavy metal resistance metalloenzyme [Hymenobacter elongatus]TGE14164.1 glyoxalase/bleomycin resistance/dioxygenase family protein [Hymenobacter elongatus]
MSSPTFPRMHVSLYVADLTATVNFYTAFFGQPATKIRPGYAKYMLDTPSLIISFVENPARVRGDFGHLGFQVETMAELQQRLDAAKRLGLVQREEIGTSCCYAKQDKFWVNDPDGVEWEVYYFHEDAEFNDPRYEQDAAEATACCIAPAHTSAAAPLLLAVPLTVAPSPDAPSAACCGS